MTRICLSEALAIIDKERGQWLKNRRDWPKDSVEYSIFSAGLRTMNYFKKEFSNLSDADQLPLGV